MLKEAIIETFDYLWTVNHSAFQSECCFLDGCVDGCGFKTTASITVTPVSGMDSVL